MSDTVYSARLNPRSWRLDITCGRTGKDYNVSVLDEDFRKNADWYPVPIILWLKRSSRIKAGDK